MKRNIDNRRGHWAYDINKRVIITTLVILLLFLMLSFYNKYQIIKIEHENLKIKYNETIEDLQQLNTKLEQEIKQMDVQFEQKIESMSAIDYNPTFNEVKEVLRNYENYKEYDEEEYNCVDYSQALVKEFQENKIYSCLTNMYLSGTYGHINVAVETSDKGVIYIEPQDETIIYELNSGDDYCDKVGWYCEEDDWKINHLKSCFD
jgi:cell division protein FtsB